MLILPAAADEAVVGTATDRISTVAAKHSGAVRNIERWGRRRLAYEIDDQNEGYYVVVTFSAEPAAQAELERTLNIFPRLRWRRRDTPRGVNEPWRRTTK